MRKARSDSVLKVLPEDRQAAIMEYLRTHSLGETRDWLRQDGLKTSVAALSSFGAWYALRQRLERNQTIVETLCDDLKTGTPELSQEQLFAVGQQLFSALAIEQGDALSWSRTQRLNLIRRQLDQDARRIAILEKKAAQADEARGVTESTMTPEEKQARYKEIFGLA